MNIDPIHADIRTAIHIKKALDHIECLQQLGYCPTKVQKFRKYSGLANHPTEEDSSSDSFAYEEEDLDGDKGSDGGEGSDGEKGSDGEEGSESPIRQVKIPKSGCSSGDLANQVRKYGTRFSAAHLIFYPVFYRPSSMSL